MREKKKIQLNLRMIAIVLIVFCTVAAMTTLLMWATREDRECEQAVLDTGFTVRYEGEVYTPEHLSDLFFDKIRKGQVLELETVIPENLNVRYPLLLFYSVHSQMQVYLDGEKIYAYGEDLYAKNKMLGYGYHFITLPEHCAGMPLKIVLTFSEKNAISEIHEIVIANANQAYRSKLVAGRFSVAAAHFLMGFGLIMLMLSILIRNQKHNFRSVLCISMLSLAIGCWSFCNRDIVTLFTTNLEYKVYLEYLSLYFFLVPFLGYFGDLILTEDTPKWMRIAYRTLFWGQVASLVVIVLCQVTNVAHLPAFLTYEHILMALSILLLAVYTVDCIRRKHKFNYHILIGFLMAVILAGVELIRYNLSKYFLGFKADGSDKSALDVAALIIVITLFWDFFHRASEIMKEEAKQGLLLKMAYRDELTGLANRRKCDDVLATLYDEGTPFAVVSLDMNFLKKMNDTYGHEAGDAALREFGRVLEASFPERAVIGRCGGDEFTVVIPHGEKPETEKCIEAMLAGLEEANKQRTEASFPLSTAYGAVYSYEKDNVHNLMVLADERMYEQKRLSKLGRE